MQWSVSSTSTKAILNWIRFGNKISQADGSGKRKYHQSGCQGAFPIRSKGAAEASMKDSLVHASTSSKDVCKPEMYEFLQRGVLLDPTCKSYETPDMHPRLRSGKPYCWRTTPLTQLQWKARATHVIVHRTTTQSLTAFEEQGFDGRKGKESKQQTAVSVSTKMLTENFIYHKIPSAISR